MRCWRSPFAVHVHLRGDYRLARTQREHVVAAVRRVLGDEQPATLGARANLAAAYWSAGRIADAITL